MLINGTEITLARGQTVSSICVLFDLAQEAGRGKEGNVNVVAGGKDDCVNVMSLRPVREAHCTIGMDTRDARLSFTSRGDGEAESSRLVLASISSPICL